MGCLALIVAGLASVLLWGLIVIGETSGYGWTIAIVLTAAAVMIVESRDG